MGPANDAGTAITGIKNDNLLGATLKLENIARTGAGVDTYAGPALQLVPSDIVDDGAPVGSITADEFGNLWTNVVFSDETTGPVRLYSTGTGNITQLLYTPQRALDTREVKGRVNVLDPSGKFDSSGRLIAGKTITLDLDPYCYAAEGVYATIAAISPAAGGWARVWAAGTPEPETANIGWTAGQNVNSFLIAAAGFVTNSSNAITIRSNATTHLIIDVWGFVVQYRAQVNNEESDAAASARAASPQAAARQQMLQKWASDNRDKL